jgi:hypothetical protein
LTPGRWTLVQHCCRFCLGRIASDGETYHCTNCGVEAAGVRDGKPVAICGCGMRPSPKSKGHLKSFACGPNPDRTPQNPAEIVILFAGAAAVPVGDAP